MTQFLKTQLLPVAALLLFWVLGPSVAKAQCNPDVTPPVAVCVEFLQVSLDPNGAAVLNAADNFNDGSYDACCLGAMELKRVTDGPCDADGAPDDYAATLTLCCEDVGTPFTVSMRVNDCAGNQMECLTEVVVEDKVNPICPPSVVSVSCENFDPLLWAYGPTDNCCIEPVVPIVQDMSQFDTLCSRGVIFRMFNATDCSGNTTSCSQTISVTYNQHYYVRFPNDVILTDGWQNGNYGEPTTFGEDCELNGFSYEDLIISDPNGSFIEVRRTWTIINWCTYDPNLPVTDVPNPMPNVNPTHPANLPGPTVSEAGAAMPWNPTIVKINHDDPAPTNYSTFWTANANAYRYTQRIYNEYFVGVEGVVFADSSSNCTKEAGEEPLSDWTVRVTGNITGQVVEVQTDANGHYFAVLGGSDTVATVTLVAASNFGQNCQTEYIVNVPTGQTVVQDVPVHLEQRCDLLTVGIATPRLRRCFPNYYNVQACNLSGQTVPNAYVEVQLDDYFVFNSSSIPGTLVSGNTYSFQLGDMAPGDCQTFAVEFTLSCDAPLGITHCSSANIFPYDDCRDANSNWSGADVEVTAVCDGDSVRLRITNVGTGDMTQVLDFVVVEDVIMRQEGSFQLDQNESLTISQPANGSTWRIEAEEEPLHPWGGVQAKALEGCGGINATGLVNLFPLSSNNPFSAEDCQQNIGAYDPNDKQGFPTGYGNQHYIKANTDIEYLIRFQNTGTDTAFTVVILDTLAQHLDAASVRVGAASHPMEFSLLEGGVLRFAFENILLPDSNVNQAASNGFVKFRISQKPDLADGVRIENSAAIYFDFNEPVITNTTFHTIGEHFVQTSVDDLANSALAGVYPNPAFDNAIFELKNQVNAATFELSNNLGQRVSMEQFSGKQYRFERRNLAAGIYHFQISAGGVSLATGKLVLR